MLKEEDMGQGSVLCFVSCFLGAEGIKKII